MHIRNLSVIVDDTPILSHVSLDIAPGALHALMGPNGSGKSTLARVLMGDEGYEITGSVHWNQHDLLAQRMEERARLGLFLAHQQPPTIPGLLLRKFLKEAYSQLHGPVDALSFTAMLNEACDLVGLDSAFLSRAVNDGLSGGEKKRVELLQMVVLQPTFAILDEVDSGLDIDGLRMIERVIAFMRSKNAGFTALVISHNPRLFEYLQPTAVSIMSSRGLETEPNAALIRKVAQHGFQQYL